MDEPQYRTEYIRRDTDRPPYVPFPVFLMDYPLSANTRILYSFLLNRAMLSQRNGWVDDLGRVFIIFPELEMCAVLHRGLSAVKKALADLEGVGLLTRERSGLGRANRIYLRIAIPTAENPAIGQSEKRPSDSRVSGHLTAGKPPASNNTESQYQNNKTVEDDTRTAYGYYENIFLSEQAYARLKEAYPYDLDRYITELSHYLKAHNRTYTDYEAGIRSWADKDIKRKSRPAAYSGNYDYEGEDSL